MITDCLALFYDLLAVADVKDPAVEVSKVFDDPRNLSCTDPLSCVSEFLLRAEIDAINQFLDLSDCHHLRHFQVILKVEPRKQSLQASVSTAPTMIIEILITIMEVLIQSSSVVLYVLILLHRFDEEMRIEQFLGRKGHQICRMTYFAIVELLDQSICCFVDSFLEGYFCVDVEIEGQSMIE